MQSELPSTLTRGWRQSLRTSAWYRRKGGWVAIVIGDDAGYRIVLKRVARTFEDALAFVNETLN